MAIYPKTGDEDVHCIVTVSSKRNEQIKLDTIIYKFIRKQNKTANGYLSIR